MKHEWKEPERRDYSDLHDANRAPLLDIGPRARVGLYVLLAVVLFVFAILPGYRLFTGS